MLLDTAYTAFILILVRLEAITAIITVALHEIDRPAPRQLRRVPRAVRAPLPLELRRERDVPEARRAHRERREPAPLQREVAREAERVVLPAVLVRGVGEQQRVQAREARDDCFSERKYVVLSKS